MLLMGIIFTLVFCGLNVIVWREGDTAGIPFLVVVLLLAIVSVIVSVALLVLILALTKLPWKYIIGAVVYCVLISWIVCKVCQRKYQRN